MFSFSSRFSSSFFVMCFVMFFVIFSSGQAELARRLSWLARLAWPRRLGWARLPAAGGWAGLGQVGLAWLDRLGWAYEILKIWV